MIPLLQNNIEKIIALCKKHHVKKLYAFGSSMRNDFSENSDIDFLYEMDYSDFNFSDLSNIPYDPFLILHSLKENLEILLNKKIDLIPNQDFKNRYLQEAIDKDKTLLYGSA